MSFGLLVVIMLGIVGGIGALVWAAAWLTRSWEVIDDDQREDRFRRTGALTGFAGWEHFRRWLGIKPRQLTYRRDERGRFRRIRR